MVSRADNNGDSGQAADEIDLSRIRFPSDDLSIRVLRKHYPSLFDLGCGQGETAQPKFFFLSGHAGHAEDVVANMLHCERVIAVSAYASVRGTKGPECFVPDFKDELAELYIRFGIASGPNHVAQLIRDIEQQAIRLANQKNI